MSASHTKEALDELVKIMKDDRAAPDVRVAAAELILNCAYNFPPDKEDEKDPGQ